MYFVTNSAFPGGLGLRERKRRATQVSLILRARQLTLEHGLTGFTVEQLCDDVGVSRRTFFNYFPGKEDAVLGLTGEGIPDELLTRFVASGRNTPRAPLLDALVDLFLDFGERMGITREEYEALSAVLQREPHLLGRLFSAAEAKSQLLAEFIVAREGLSEDDPMPGVATFVLGGLARRSLDRFFAEDNLLTYAQILHRDVGALRYLCALPDPSSQTSSQNQDPA